VYNDKNNILYSASIMNKMQINADDKNYLTQEKAFYSRNNINGDKLNLSPNSNEENNSSNYIDISNNNNNNKIINNNIKTNEINNFSSYKYDINKANINILNHTQNSLHNDIIYNKNRKNIINNDNKYRGDRIEHLSNIPNYRNHDRIHNNGSESHHYYIIHNQDTNNQEIYYNQINEVETNTHSFNVFFRTITNNCYNLYIKFCNIPSVNRFIKNKDNYYDEIKKTLYLATCQGFIWGIVFSFIGYFYSNCQIGYSLLTFFRYFFFLNKNFCN